MLGVGLVLGIQDRGITWDRIHQSYQIGRNPILVLGHVVSIARKNLMASMKCPSVS